MNAAEKQKIDVVIATVIAELGKLGHAAMRGRRKDYETPCIEFDDGIQVDVYAQQSRGKWRLIVGNYLDDRAHRENLPEPKTGFRVGEVAVLVWTLAEARRAKNATEEREEQAAEEAAQINDSLGTDNNLIGATTDGKGNLVLRSRATGTAEQITAVLRAAIEVGLATASKGEG